MLKIKLSPQGKKHQLSYKVVISPSQTKHNGKYIEEIGFWYPFTQTIKIDQDRLKYWQTQGAQVTLGVDKLLHPELHPKTKKVKPVTAPST